jgi:phospholipase C
MNVKHFSKLSMLAGGALALALVAPTAAGSAATTSLPTNFTLTPIKHVVVIFQENVSFDHYFGTYPKAANNGSGQPFTAAAGTPAVNGLTPALLTKNPNGVNPRRYDPGVNDQNFTDLLTCDQDHGYTDEQTAEDGGKMDKFPQTVGNGTGTSPEGGKCVAGDVMNYYDGNTVTALWNYAQRFAMSDNSYGTTFGPSSPGAINLISGDTGGVDPTKEINGVSKDTANADVVTGGDGTDTLTSDAQPYYDDCSTRDAVAITGKNIGDLLNARGISWGWFQGGFRPTTTYSAALHAVGADGQPTSAFMPDQFKAAGFNASVPHSSNQGLCDAVHPVGLGLPAPATGTGQYGYKDDYIPHHEPFEYYASTANPHHLTVPTNAAGQDTVAGLEEIGTDTQSYTSGKPNFDTPNHQYDTSDFDQLVAAIGAGQLPGSALPAVSFLKAPGYQDGHAGYSDPIDEQQFVVNEINSLEKLPTWNSTAVIISYDDSDGWYDHQFAGIQNPSISAGDNLTGAGQCGTEPPAPLAGEQGRCGNGPRLPLLVISPWSQVNYVDHSMTNQTSIIASIEDNWLLGRIPGSDDAHTNSLIGMFKLFPTSSPLLLNPNTGEPTGA